ncbi:MAG TPA: hypothetical protein VIG50_20365 [Vicinamibacteria bacterium]
MKRHVTTFALVAGSSILLAAPSRADLASDPLPASGAVALWAADGEPAGALALAADRALDGSLRDSPLAVTLGEHVLDGSGLDRLRARVALARQMSRSGRSDHSGDHDDDDGRGDHGDNDDRGDHGDDDDKGDHDDDHDNDHHGDHDDDDGKGDHDGHHDDDDDGKPHDDDDDFVPPPDDDDDEVPPQVAEPGLGVLTGLGLIGLAAYRRRRA